jgi:hypothetical protein
VAIAVVVVVNKDVDTDVDVDVTVEVAVDWRIEQCLVAILQVSACATSSGQ